MADTKLSALTELATKPATDDELYIRDVSEAAADESKRITVANLMSATLTVADTEVFNGNPSESWTDLDLSGTIGAQTTLVMLKLISNNATPRIHAFRRNGDTDEFYDSTLGAGCVQVDVNNDNHSVVWVATDSGGIIEWIGELDTITIVMDVMAYIK